MTHGEITIEIKSDTLSEAISIRDFLVTFNQVLSPECCKLSYAEGNCSASQGLLCLRLSRNVQLLQPFLTGLFVSMVSAVNREPRYQGADLL